jgi:hypothetical protein
MAQRRGRKNLDAAKRHFLHEHVKIVFRPAGRGQPVKAAVTIYGLSEKEAKSKHSPCSLVTVDSVLYCPQWPGC